MPPHAQNAVAVALVGEDNTGYRHVLAARHGTEYAYTWTLPGADTAPRESPTDAAERVLEQQADIGIYVQPAIGTYDIHGHDPDEACTVWAFWAWITWAYTERPDGLPSRDHMSCYWIREDALSPDFPGLPPDLYEIARNALALQAAAR